MKNHLFVSFLIKWPFYEQITMQFDRSSLAALGRDRLTGFGELVIHNSLLIPPKVQRDLLSEAILS